MSRASLETYHKNLESGVFSERRQQVYEAVFNLEQKNPDRQGFTHSEIYAEILLRHSFPKNYRNNWIARLLELCDMNVMRTAGDGTCPINGETCTFWATTDEAARALPKAKVDPNFPRSRKECHERIRFLLYRNVELEKEVNTLRAAKKLRKHVPADHGQMTLGEL